MMNCRECTNNLYEYINNHLDIQTREKVESHLFSCVVCEREWQHRAVLALREIEGLSYEEIAAILDIPLGMVELRINHAHKELRRTFKEEGRDDEVPRMCKNTILIKKHEIL